MVDAFLTGVEFAGNLVMITLFALLFVKIIAIIEQADNIERQSRDTQGH